MCNYAEIIIYNHFETFEYDHKTHGQINESLKKQTSYPNYNFTPNQLICQNILKGKNCPGILTIYLNEPSLDCFIKFNIFYFSLTLSLSVPERSSPTHY